jgi:putative transposase
MALRYKNKYRIKSARAPWWNYAWAGAYFITICTQNRKHYFGEIVNGAMQSTQVGEIAEKCWHEITKHAHDIELGDFVVMPNHIHGILKLQGNVNQKSGSVVSSPVDTVDIVETRTASFLPQYASSLPLPQQPPQPQQTEQQPQSQRKNSISCIIGSYKSAVTKYSHLAGLEMAWQPRFHDHIIRNDQEYVRIANYIKSNPGNWDNDKFR